MSDSIRPRPVKRPLPAEPARKVRPGGAGVAVTACMAPALIGLLLIAERIGPLHRSLSVVAGTMLLGAAIWGAVGSGRVRDRGTWRWWALGTLALALAVWVPAWWRPAAAGLAFYTFSRTALRPVGRSMLECLALQSALLALMLPWLDAAPVLLRLEQTWAAGLSGIAQAISGRPVLAGGSMLGFDAVVGVLALALALVVRGARPRSSLLLRLVAAQSVPLAWAWALSRLPGMDSPVQITPAPEAPVSSLLAGLAVDSPVMWSALVVTCAVALVTPVLFGGPFLRLPATPPASPRSSRLAAGVAVACLACAGALPAWHQKPATARDRGVVVYEHGFLNWLRPDTTRYGRMSAGMLGMLPDYLSALGLKPRRIPAITLETLGDAKVLVFVNLEHLLPPDEQELLWAWVRAGGHLVVFGEHTWHRPAGNPANALLEPSQIRLRHDSANFMTAGWINGYRFTLDPLTAGLSPDGNDPGIVVGASLECGPAARPLILGRYGYSDAPSLSDSTGGYVGDLRYGTGEPVGDLVLCATQPIERGRVTVFGDTSPVFNGIAASTFVFGSRLFLWAAAGPAEPRGDAFLAYAVVLGLIGCSLVASSAIAPAALVLAGLLAAAGGLVGYGRMSTWPQPFVAGRIALVDSSFLPTSYVGGWEEDDMFGLSLACMRSGYLTLHPTSLAGGLLERAQLLALIAPRRTLSERDASRIVRWMEGGGTLVLAAGAEEQEPSRALLERLGVTIRPRPLGKLVARDGTHQVPMPEAWPLTLTAAGAARAESLLTFEGELLGARLPVGKGQAVVIGDAQFFRNFNLEHGEHEHAANVAFVARMLAASADARSETP